jgi:acetyl esterase/lipase
MALPPFLSKLLPQAVLPLWPTRCAVGDGNAAEDFQPVLDCYPLPGDRPRPAMVILPGGGYGVRAPHEGVDVAERFNTLGMHAFVVQYRVAPYRFPAPQLDAFRAIRMVRALAGRPGNSWRLIAGQLAVCGFSAGGHLAASTGTMFADADVNALAGDDADAESPRPDALVLGYPVISFNSEWGHTGSGRNLLGAGREAENNRFSLEQRVSAGTPPTFLWHTADDGGVPVENSLRFVSALQRCGVPWGLHVFPHGRHGLGLAPECRDIRIWSELAAEFLVAGAGFELDK